MGRRTVAWLLAAVVAVIVAAVLLVRQSLDPEPASVQPSPVTAGTIGPPATGPREGTHGRPPRPRNRGTAADPQRRFRSGVAELLHSGTHRSAATATLRFGPPTERMNGELLFGDGGDEFAVRLGGADQSLIVDLGPGSLDDVAAGRVRIMVPPDARDRIPAVEGHVYAVRSHDAESDRMSVFRVESLVPRDRVRLVWIDASVETDGVESPVVAEMSPEVRDAIGARLAELTGALEAAASGARAIADAADVVLQIRTGAQGGNESRVTLGPTSGWHRVDDVASVPFDVVAPPNKQDRSRGYTSRSFVPRDKAWVIEAVDVSARADGDSNGGGEIAVRIAGTQVFWAEKDPRPFLGWFEGRAVVRPGEEKDVILAAANSSVAEVRLHGRLVPLADAASITAVPFRPAPAPDGAVRAAGGPEASRTNLLVEPRFRLAIASGTWAGEDLRTVSLAGGREIGPGVETDRVDIDRALAPLEVRRWSPALRIPPGKALAVTKVTWRGHARGEGDEKGATSGGARIAVGGTAILESPQTPGALTGEWNGRVLVESGQEETIVVAVRSTSALDVQFEGEFVALDSGRR